MVAIIFVFTYLSGCISATNKKIDADLAKELPEMSGMDLGSEISIAQASLGDLTVREKTQIDELRDETSNKLWLIKQESLKLRFLLIKSVLSPLPHLDEQGQLMRRLRATSNKRLNLIFEAVERTNAILGHTAPKQHLMVERMFDKLDK